MRKFRIALAVVLAVVLYTLTGTMAARAAATADPVRTAYELAVSYWHGAPPCGTPSITEKVPPSDLEGGVADADIADGDDVVPAWADPAACAIYLNPESVWGNAELRVTMFHWLCDDMVHEVGHLFGHEDDEQVDPTSIEYPVIQEGSPNFNSVPECSGIVL